MRLYPFRPDASIAAAAALWLATACHSPIAAAADAVRIEIKDYMFEPMTVTVTAGTTVTWANLDEDPHTVVGDAGAFRSGGIDTGQEFSFTFDTAGTYHFTCSIHPRMVGTIVVQ